MGELDPFQACASEVGNVEAKSGSRSIRLLRGRAPVGVESYFLLFGLRANAAEALSSSEFFVKQFAVANHATSTCEHCTCTGLLL